MSKFRLSESEKNHIKSLYESKGLIKKVLSEKWYEKSCDGDCDDGYGEKTYRDGSIYKGQFKNGYRDGYGSMKFANGDSYEGDWKNAERDGYGTYKWPDGSYYQGDWKNGKINGYGTEKEVLNSDGTNGYDPYTTTHYYKGEFKDGERHGYGVITYSDGIQMSITYDMGNMKSQTPLDAPAAGGTPPPTSPGNGGVSLPPDSGSGGGGVTPPPPTTTYDVPTKVNWEEAKAYILSKPNSVSGYFPEPNPEYEFAKYLDSNRNYMEIKSNGRAQEADPQFKLVHTGTWKWNGSEVIFSWQAKNKVSNDDWNLVKKRFEDTKGQDYFDDMGIPNGNTFEYYEEGEWTQGGYKYAKVWVIDENNIQHELEIRDNFTWVRYNRTKDDLKKAGKWLWNGTNIEFKVEKSGRDTKKLDDSDKDLYTALFLKNKIGSRGSRGPAVQELQQLVTPDDNQDYGTGQGCKSDKNKCDGKYGPKTAELVKKYQEDNKVKVDGIFGKETYRAGIVNPQDIGDLDID